MDEVIQRKPYKRQLRSVLVHKPMQREFTLVVISLLIISALTIGFVIHYTIRDAMMGGGFRFGKISPYEVMSDVAYDLITRVTLVLFVTIFIIVLFGVFFLHRIAGPVYRFRSVVRQITKGEVPGEFRLREGDYFTETADDLNVLIRAVKQRSQSIESLRKKLDDVIQRHATASVRSDLEELKRVVDKMAA